MQRMEALQRANEIRTRRAQLKRNHVAIVEGTAFPGFQLERSIHPDLSHVVAIMPYLHKLGENGTLSPTSPQQALENLKSGQLRRCPGGATQPAADKSSPFANELLTCDPLQTP